MTTYQLLFHWAPALAEIINLISFSPTRFCIVLFSPVGGFDEDDDDGKDKCACYEVSWHTVERKTLWVLMSVSSSPSPGNTETAFNQRSQGTCSDPAMLLCTSHIILDPTPYWGLCSEQTFTSTVSTTVPRQRRMNKLPQCAVPILEGSRH